MVASRKLGNLLHLAGIERDTSGPRIRREHGCQGVGSGMPEGTAVSLESAGRGTSDDA